MGQHPPVEFGPDPAARADPVFAPVIDALGAPGSVDLVPTPALLCDVDLLVGNVAAMQQVAVSNGLHLRPHAKSHKSAWVAGLQLDHGAIGICCAKLSEAEALVGALDREVPVPVLVTSPLADARAVARVARLAARCDLAVVVDHVDGVAELAGGVVDDPGITVLCDVDVGLGRTGVTGPSEAVAVADAVERAPGSDSAASRGTPDTPSTWRGARPDGGPWKWPPNDWPGWSGPSRPPGTTSPSAPGAAPGRRGSTPTPAY